MNVRRGHWSNPRRWCLAGSHRRPARHGISLIEMVVVISIMAVMLSGGVVLLGLLLRADTAGHNAIAAQMTTSRLNRQFRADAHLSTSVAEASEPAGALELQLVDGSRVVWSAAGADITRTVRRNDSIVSRDSFTLADGNFSLTRESSGSLITIRHTRPYAAPLENGTDDRPQPQIELRILAAVGIGVDAAVHANAGRATPATGDAN